MLRLPVLWNSCGLIAAVLCIVSCGPKESAVVVPATNAPPAVAAPVSEPVTNPPAVASPAAAPGTITPEEAKNHVGETATVRGKVFNVHVTQKGDVFINIGGKHPNAPFTAVCFKQALPTEELKALDGKTISVRGTIKEYNGQVEIILESADQILK